MPDSSFHPIFGANVEYEYERLNGQTPANPNGFKEWGKAWAIPDRHGLTLYREGQRDCPTSSGKGKGKGKSKGYGDNTVYSATKYICHPNGTWSYHNYDNMGESHHGTFQANGGNGKNYGQIGLGQVARYNEGTHNIVTAYNVEGGYSKGCINEQESIGNSPLATTRYMTLRSFSACDQRANDAIDRHNDDRCGNGFFGVSSGGGGNLFIWVICIIIIIIIIVIIIWAVRGGRRQTHHQGQMGWGGQGGMGWGGQGGMGYSGSGY